MICLGRICYIVDGAFFVFEGVEERVSHVICMRLKYGLNEENVCVKSAFVTGVAVFLPFAV